MSAPTLPREPENLRARWIWAVGVATVVLSLALTGVAWLFVRVPSGSPAAAMPSSLRHDLFETAGSGFARIPIEHAIDMVVANPRLIGGAP